MPRVTIHRKLLASHRPTHKFTAMNCLTKVLKHWTQGNWRTTIWHSIGSKLCCRADTPAFPTIYNNVGRWRHAFRREKQSLNGKLWRCVWNIAQLERWLIDWRNHSQRLTQRSSDHSYELRVTWLRGAAQRSPCVTHCTVFGCFCVKSAYEFIRRHVITRSCDHVNVLPQTFQFIWWICSCLSIISRRRTFLLIPIVILLYHFWIGDYRDIPISEKYLLTNRLSASDIFRLLKPRMRPSSGQTFYSFISLFVCL